MIINHIALIADRFGELFGSDHPGAFNGKVIHDAQLIGKPHEAAFAWEDMVMPDFILFAVAHEDFFFRGQFVHVDVFIIRTLPAGDDDIITLKQLL